jgi:uncharacterized protein YjdB
LHSGNASLSIAPTFAPLPPGAPSIQLSKISGVLVGPGGDSIVVTAKFDGDSAILVFDVQVTGNATEFTLNLIAFDMNGVVAYQSTQSVTVKPGDNPGLPTPVLVYAAPDSKIQTLHVSPSSAVMKAGETASFSATGTAADGTTIPPIRLGWTVHDPSVATVDDDGNVHSGAFQGSTWVVARTANNVADSASITVHAPVDHVSLSATSVQIVHGNSSSVTAQLIDAGGHVIDDRQAAWSSSDPTVATVSSSGSVQGVKVGTATLTASAEGKSAAVAVSVVSAVDHIDLTPSSLTFATLGQSQSVSAHIVARAGASVDGIVAALTSSNPFVATVSSDGKVTAMSEGSTTITATADGVTATTSVTVKQVPASVTVSPSSGSVTALGDAFNFKAAVYDASGNAIPSAVVSWSTSDSKVASIDSDGRVIAGKLGSATITATDGPVSGSASFTATQTPKTLTVTSDKSTFMVTYTATLTAKEFDANSNPITPIKPVWSTTTPTIASVSADGVVTGVAVGTAHVVATSDGLTKAIDLTVTSLPAVTLVLNATTGNLLPSGTMQFSVTSGGTGPFAWTVNDISGGNSTVGTVSSSGLYTAPSTIPSSALVSVCVTEVSPPGNACADVKLTSAPVLDVATTEVIVGETHQFSVASGGTSPFTWLVHNAVGGDATYGTISSSGLYTAPSSVPSTATFDVCVTQAAPSAQACAHVTVDPSPTLDVTTLSIFTGGAHRFTASGLVGTPTWTATSGTITNAGTDTATYTAPSTVPSGTVQVCVSESTPLAQTCATVTVNAATVTLTLNVPRIEKLPGGTQSFTVSGGTGPYAWKVNDILNGNLTYGTINASGNTATYTAPAATPSPATFDICVSQAGPPAASVCASATIDPIPSSGEDVVVLNDFNMFDNLAGQDVNNQLLYQNLVNFTTTGTRGSNTDVMFYIGHNPLTTPDNIVAETITDANYTVTTESRDLDNAIGSQYKAVFLWLPKTAFSATEINNLKSFASEGGRIIFIGEYGQVYGNGIDVENAFLSDMGAQMTNTGGAFDCAGQDGFSGYPMLPSSRISTHQVTTGMTDLTLACASAVTLGPNDYALFRSFDGTKVLGGVAKIDVTPLSINRIPLRRPSLNVSPTTPTGRKPWTDLTRPSPGNVPKP